MEESSRKRRSVILSLIVAGATLATGSLAALMAGIYSHCRIGSRLFHRGCS